MWAFLAPALILMLFWGCSPAPRYTSRGVPRATVSVLSTTEKPRVGSKFRGVASFYADEYHGRKTANGEVFDMYGLTCAHNGFPFDTWLEVRNLANKRTVIVRVNDRGPFIDGRIIDLSYGAAREIGMIEKGVQEVEITVIR